MSFSYQCLAGTVAREIAEKGRDIILRRRSHGFDPATGQMNETVSEQSLRGLFTLYELSQRDGTTVRQGDQALLLAAEDLTAAPSEADEVIDDGSSWQVMSVERLQPGGTALLYRLQVRQ